MAFKNHILIILLLILHLRPPYAAAQTDSFKPNTGEISPSTVVVIIIAIVFMFTGFLAVFLRRFSDGCFGLSVTAPGGGGAAGFTAARGLDPEAIKSIPTYFYSDVKQHRLAKVELECAVCLSEFQDPEALRLLPGCSHVFHPRCIDRWLVSHVTCPICRRSLEPGSGDEKLTTIMDIPLTQNESDGPDQSTERDDQNDYDVDDHHHMDGCEGVRYTDEKEMKRIVGKFPRSHSTGHSLADSERFTLRLPDGVQTSLVDRSRYAGEPLTSMISPRCGWFSMTPPIINPRAGSVRSPVRAGLSIGGSKNLPLRPVKTSEHLWPI